MRKRFTWAMELDSKFGEMSRSVRKLLLDDEAVAYLRFYMIDLAQKYVAYSGDVEKYTRCEDSDYWVGKMFGERGDPVVAALRSKYDVNPKGRVLASALTAFFKGLDDEGIPVPRTNQRTRVIKLAFPKATDGRSGGKRFWFGFAERT